MGVKRCVTLAPPVCVTRTHSNPTCLAWPAPSLTSAVTQPPSSSHQRARHFWPRKTVTCVSIPFTSKGKPTLLRVTGLCLVSPPPPFPSVRVLRPLELAWRQDFPLGTIIMVFTGYRQQSSPPPPWGTCPCGTCPECPLCSQQPS